MTDGTQGLTDAPGQSVPLSDGLDGQLLKLAVNELMKIPRYYESEGLTLAKVRLKDGRYAVIRIELTTDSDVVEDASIWKPLPLNV